MLSGRAKGLLTGVLFLLGVGGLLNIEEMFVMATALAALLGISYAVAVSSARAVVADVDIPSLVPCGEEFDASVRLRGAGVTSESRLDVVLSLPPDLDVVQASPVRVEGHSATTAFRLCAKARGVHQIRLVRVVVRDPLGMVAVPACSRGPIGVTAFPKPLDPRVLWQEGAQMLAPGARSSGVRAPDGTGLYGLRKWVPGDPSRHVHWPATARQGSLVVMELEADSTSDTLVLLDVRKVPAGGGEAFEAACRVAAFLLQQEWALGRRASVVADGYALVSRVDGRDGLSELARLEALRTLACVQPTSGQPLADFVAGAVLGVRFAGSVVLVTPQWDGDAEQALGLLSTRGQGHEALVVCPRTGGREDAPGDEDFKVAVVTGGEHASG